MVLESLISSDTPIREHVLADLRPYICIYKECKKAEKDYPSRSEFVDHEVFGHEIPDPLWVKFEGVNCPFCGETLQNSATERGRHIGRHMEEIAFAVVTKPYEAWEFYSDSTSDSSLGDHPSISPPSPGSPNALPTQTSQIDRPLQHRYVGQAGHLDGPIQFQSFVKHTEEAQMQNL